MPWEVQYHPEFRREFEELPRPVKVEFESIQNHLVSQGPALGRPHADTLDDSRFPNMKELRFNAARGVWRIAFAFDPERQAILLVAANKRGSNQRQFYKRFVRVADSRYTDHLSRLRE